MSRFDIVELNALVLDYRIGDITHWRHQYNCQVLAELTGLSEYNHVIARWRMQILVKNTNEHTRAYWKRRFDTILWQIAHPIPEPLELHEFDDEVIFGMITHWWIDRFQPRETVLNRMLCLMASCWETHGCAKGHEFLTLMLRVRLQQFVASDDQDPRSRRGWLAHRTRVLKVRPSRCACRLCWESDSAPADGWLETFRSTFVSPTWACKMIYALGDS